VRIASNRDRSFTWVQSEELGGSGRNEFHETIRAEPACGNSVGINQAHAMFNAWASVGDFRKVISSQFFLLLEAEWTMVGRDILKMVALKAIPQFLLMPFLAQRRGKHILRAFEIGSIHVLDGK